MINDRAEAPAERGEADKRIRRVLIVGGGTAGWMAAAALAKALTPMGVQIEVLESEQIAGVGVGEATVPSIMDFIRSLDIDEDELVRETKATFKLGIAHRDWSKPGDTYFHPFGPIGQGMGAVSFQAYWLKMFLAGKAARLETYSIQSMAAALNRFTRPRHAPGTPLNKIVYALHFDAGLFAHYLRGFAEKLGVRRTEGKLVSVSLGSESGMVESVALQDGETIKADLFIDCSGFASVLLGDALKTPYQDWSSWLPCDRAVVVQSSDGEAPTPYTLVTAGQAGWQWRIPLQHRTGNGHVYSSAFLSDDAAHDALLSGVTGRALTEPAILKFTPGRRAQMWRKNCVALGLASGFLEPLEATSIHMIQRGLSMLLKFFPDRSFEQADIDRYNRTLEFEFDRVRDFLLLHYTLTQRDGAFWRHCRAITAPDSFDERLRLFRGHGRIVREESELFPIQSWLSIMVGQKLLPRSHDPVSDTLGGDQIMAKLGNIASSVRQCVEAMPAHEHFIRDHCQAL